MWTTCTMFFLELLPFSVRHIHFRKGGRGGGHLQVLKKIYRPHVIFKVLGPPWWWSNKTMLGWMSVSGSILELHNSQWWPLGSILNALCRGFQFFFLVAFGRPTYPTPGRTLDPLGACNKEGNVIHSTCYYHFEQQVLMAIIQWALTVRHKFWILNGEQCATSSESGPPARSLQSPIFGYLWGTSIPWFRVPWGYPFRSGI